MLSNYPEKLEVYMRADNSDAAPLIQVTDDYMKRYNKTTSYMDDFKKYDAAEWWRRKRSMRGNTRVLRCYGWSEFNEQPIDSEYQQRYWNLLQTF